MRTEAKAAVKNSIGRLMFAALGFDTGGLDHYALPQTE